MLIAAEPNETRIVFEFPDTSAAIGFWEAWTGRAERSHRVVEVVTRQAAEARALAKTFRGYVAG